MSDVSQVQAVARWRSKVVCVRAHIISEVQMGSALALQVMRATSLKHGRDRVEEKDEMMLMWW
jgi:hypothetical protein